METRMSNFYAIKVTAGQELNVALSMEERVKVQGLSEVYAIIVPPSLKGYVIVEATGPHVVKLIISGMRFVKGIAQGMLSKEDVAAFLEKKSVVQEFKPGDMVEVVSGPFKGMQAQVIRNEKEKNEIVLKILDSAFPLQVTVPTDYISASKKK